MKIYYLYEVYYLYKSSSENSIHIKVILPITYYHILINRFENILFNF